MNLLSFGLVLLTICTARILTKNINIYKSLSGHVVYNEEDNSLILTCLPTTRFYDVFPPIPVKTLYKEVKINLCETKRSYFEDLQALNINASAIETLHLLFGRETPLQHGNYTQGLLIETLKLNNFQENEYDLFQNVRNFLEPLINLKYLSATRLKLPPLPESARVVTLSLNYATIKDWGNCRYLKNLEIEHSYLGNFPVWPKECKKLESLTINKLPINADIVIKSMMPAVQGLRTLKINHCLLDDFPLDILNSAENLIALDLSDTSIVNAALRYYPDGNYISTRHFKYLVPRLPKLRKISLGTLTVTSFCVSSYSFAMLQNWTIEYIHLINIYFDFSCMSGLHFKHLKKIEMSFENYTMSDEDIDDNIMLNNMKFKVMDLPKTDAETLEVGIRVNRRMKFLFDESDFNALKGEISFSSSSRHNSLTVYTEHVISCDCEHGWLARALREFPKMISMPRVLCYPDNWENHIIHILDKPLERLECNRTEDDDCIYRKSWRDGKVIAECKKEAWEKEELPQNLHGLNVSGRGITTLRSKISENLQCLDLRRNAISRGNAEEAAALFAAGRRIWLANNSLLCDCDNRALLDAIQQYRNQVEDYDLLKCAVTDEAISKISTVILCHTVVIAVTAFLGVCGVLALIAGLITLLLRRYGEQLRMFLYSRGWFVSCLQKQDLDDKPYDAFLSFAHEDREYVMETLLPGLENAPEQFRVCVHYRDWPIGDWIPDQIMRSVQLSKRTLILLSRNFVASAWSTLEFRYSLANTTEDPNVKVLVLIKDDVLDIELDMELRRYLTFNTYLRCDDRWFWEKLRYAMPHRLKKKQSLSEDINGEIRTKVIDMRAAVAAISNSRKNVKDLDDLHV